LPHSKIEEEPKIVQAPKVIHRVLEEFKDVMPAKLPKRLPPRRKVDHAIELKPWLSHPLLPLTAWHL